MPNPSNLRMSGVINGVKDFFFGTPAYAEQLSPHFKREEFNQPKERLSNESIKVDPELINKLERLRALIGDRPIRVTSGYRSKEYNEKIDGAAKNSKHISGEAADIMVAGMSAKQLRSLAIKAGFPYTQTYSDKPHLHVDVRGKGDTTLEQALRSPNVQAWWSQMTKLDPRLEKVGMINFMQNGPSGYDYFKALRMGVLPEFQKEHGQYRWVSDNPNLWKEGSKYEGK